ncbi:MAG: hypothetical protein FWG46_07890 [Treponema sp.]|nr:hypothetical protein [Treponema sp.]
MPKMKNADSVYDESPAYPWYKTISVPSMRPVTIRCFVTILINFFLRQYHAAFLPGRVPVSRVDHPLDQKIPFIPSWVTIYLDFVFFWLRMLTFLLKKFGRRSFPEVRNFIETMGGLYVFACESYRKNFSTTERPFYIARPRFFIIHLLDPHLMCIPSLHVMVVIRTYTKFAEILRSYGEAENHAVQIEELKQGALAISQAILYVKQHSVNCIPAALYAMTCFDEKLFPPEEAEAFTALLFGETPSAPSFAGSPPANYRVRPWAAPCARISPEDAAVVKAHIISLYRRFLAEGKTAAAEGHSWEKPLLDFMRDMPRK